MKKKSEKKIGKKKSEKKSEKNIPENRFFLDFSGKKWKIEKKKSGKSTFFEDFRKKVKNRENVQKHRKTKISENIFTLNIYHNLP